MKRLSYIFTAAAVSLLFSGCGIYNTYEQKTEIPADVFGRTQDITTATDGTSIAMMSWREFFVDLFCSNSSNRCWTTTPT